MRGFQSGGFQSNGFQQLATAAQQTSGGWEFPERRRKTKEEINEERIALGIIPAPVQKVVEKAARRVIARAKQQDTSTTAPDPIQWLEARQAQQKAILAADLRNKRIDASLAAQRTYMILLRIEIEEQMLEQANRLQDIEDEQIVRLLLEF